MAAKMSGYRWTAVGIIVLVMLGSIISLLLGKADKQQPIAFNHKKHIDNNVPCSFCHRYYRSSRSAGMPTVAVCRTCHEDVIYLTPEKAKIQRYLESGEPILWQQVYKAKPHVFFSHRLHVDRGGLVCEQCHGDVAAMERPFTFQPVPLNMNNCIHCHETVEKIDNPYECIRCHR